MPYLIAFLVYCFSVVSNFGTYGVTSMPQAVSYYSLAYDYYGSNVFLAHEDGAGSVFDELVVGDFIQAGYPDGLRLYRVTEIKRYTARSPQSVLSSFTDTETGAIISSIDLGVKIYTHDTLILQTCYDNAGGRLFVIARPYDVR